MDQQIQREDKILVSQCVTIISVICLALSGFAMWLFRSDANVASAILQVIFAVVTACVSGLMGIAVGKEMEKRKNETTDDLVEGE